MKKILIFTLVTVMTLLSFAGCAKTENTLTTVKVNEVTHSVFYAPQYVAITMGYFEEAGLNVEITNGGGADKTMTAVLSGDADIGLCGPEATIYVYNQGNEVYAQTFARLTQCDGSFLLGRENIDNFTIDMLKGTTIIGGRKGGMPVMVLEWILKQNGLTPGVDVEVDTSIAFNAMAGAFISGTGDYVSLFEPTATSLQNENKGYIVMSLGEESGEVPYTTYCAKKSFIDENPEIIENFTNAINKAQTYVYENDATTVANAIAEFFPDTSIEDLANAVQSYKNINAYSHNTVFTKDAFDLLQDIVIEAGELTEKVNYEDLVRTEFMQ